MVERLGSAATPTGWMARVYRAPIWLYTNGLGWVLGGRFVLINHRGRRSGQLRRNVVEVVKHDPATDTFWVASGFGATSQWYRNLIAHPRCVIQVGSRRYIATAVPLAPEESGEAMVDYAHRHPLAARELMRMCGWSVDGRDDDYRALGREHIPFLRFETR